MAWPFLRLEFISRSSVADQHSAKQVPCGAINRVQSNTVCLSAHPEDNHHKQAIPQLKYNSIFAVLPCSKVSFALWTDGQDDYIVELLRKFGIALISAELARDKPPCCGTPNPLTNMFPFFRPSVSRHAIWRMVPQARSFEEVRLSKVQVMIFEAMRLNLPNSVVISQTCLSQ